MHIQVTWTVPALDEARRRGVSPSRPAPGLTSDAQVGDYVEMRGAGGTVTFIVRRRTWAFDADASVVLRIELDYPPRPDGLR
ncbi:MAG: hypothetical protein IT516_08635 [Burkholderiales bacterium]|nr:hypothetical protein [Burkholderiales bacterium]